MNESTGSRPRPTPEVAVDEVTVDELDLALVNAMQLRPRAPWSLLGQTLGISPVTAARRWRRLSEAGIAWVTAYGLPHPEDRGCVAYLDLDCAPGRLRQIADELAEDPHVMSIEHLSQGCDLVVTAAFTDLAMVSRYTTERLGRLPGVNAVRVHLATGFYAEGIRWRLDSLDPTQRVELHDDHPAGNGPPSGVRAEVREEDRELLIRLGVDGRLDQAELAAATGLSPSTLRRRLDRLAASDAIRFRCEIAARDAGRPVMATFRADLPPDRLDEVGLQLARLPEIRLCVSVTGPHNLILSVWQRSLADVHRLETALARRFPDLRVAERRVSLRTVKRMGRILDADGRAVRAVPMDIWRDPIPVSFPGT
ncbi:DNA-binding Lrp family transcriptional regulator [Kitasatospora sp. MAP12-15]|uniref:AsnC family transcriptional regulator n=1 Tax=unclassified Kitasatospora TaxID=2633591 RepID=UPI0024738487|nr:AsnC family transcriptional regulator [Kitasatospora sp. MAP12-44]MDH6109857.1 DNA-binding Lrp family transcriptional regulator [Kitasatospora sp. MAP12-44]